MRHDDRRTHPCRRCFPLGGAPTPTDAPKSLGLQSGSLTEITLYVGHTHRPACAGQRVIFCDRRLKQLGRADPSALPGLPGSEHSLGSVCIVGNLGDQLLEQMEQGWNFTDGSVCGGCVEDEALRTILRENEDVDLRCDFCRSIPAAHLDTLLEAFVNGLRNEYENALDGVGWDGREGGFQWHPKWDTWDLVDDFYWVFSGGELLDAVRAAVHAITWVEKDFITRRRDEVLIEAWDRFCEVVKHKTRFVIWLLRPDDDDLAPGEIPPAKILEHVTPLIERLNLVRDLPAGHRVWRARTHCTSPIERTASKLGTVPKKFALKANRIARRGFRCSMDPPMRTRPSEKSPAHPRILTSLGASSNSPPIYGWSISHGFRPNQACLTQN